MLSPVLAEKFASLALAHVEREYPNKLDHVMAGPADARGHAAVWNAALVYGFTGVSGAIVFAVLYLVPRAG